MSEKNLYVSETLSRRENVIEKPAARDFRVLCDSSFLSPAHHRRYYEANTPLCLFIITASFMRFSKFKTTKFLVLYSEGRKKRKFCTFARRIVVRFAPGTRCYEQFADNSGIIWPLNFHYRQDNYARNNRFDNSIRAEAKINSPRKKAAPRHALSLSLRHPSEPRQSMNRSRAKELETIFMRESIYSSVSRRSTRSAANFTEYLSFETYIYIFSKATTRQLSQKNFIVRRVSLNQR